MSAPRSLGSFPFSKLGYKRFVLLFGILGWGLPVGILFTLLQVIEEGWDGFLIRLIVSVILFPIGGIAFGHFLWKWNERRHAKLVAKALK